MSDSSLQESEAHRQESLPDLQSLSDDQFVRFRDFIVDRSGVLLGSNRCVLLRRYVAQRLDSLRLGSADDYYDYIRYRPAADEETQRLLDALIVRDTSFYRIQSQMQVLERRILPELIRARQATNTRKLRFWSAGCATGEEPYTLAIQVRQALGQEFSRWDVHILGGDISERALAQAREGHYGEYVLRHLDVGVKARYFQEVASGHWTLNREIVGMVHYEHQNLAKSADLRKVGDMDLILCRNVLMYFDVKARNVCVSGLHASLVPGGHLLIGAAETLRESTPSFQLLNWDEAILYRKA